MRTIFVLGSASLQQWLADFATCTAKDTVVIATPEIDCTGVHDLIAATSAGLTSRNERPIDNIVFFSEHETMIRDAFAGAWLEPAGHRVLTQRLNCATAGYDKFLMKALLRNFGLPTLDWCLPGESLPRSARSLVAKPRYGTRACGARRLSDDESLSENEYAEPFLTGTEFSVNVVVDSQGGWATFPPVWKGRTQDDLLPPFKRTRLCPLPDLDAKQEASLRETALRLARNAGCQGFFEVEFIEDHSGSMIILEFNPRVSGTLRMSLAAAGVRGLDFWLHGAPNQHVRAVNCAIELPLRLARPTTVPGVYATTRTTVSAESYPLVLRKLTRLELPIPNEVQPWITRSTS